MSSPTPMLHLLGDARLAVAIGVAAPVIAWKLKWLTKGGMVAAAAVGVAAYAAFDWPAYLLLAAYFVTTELISRHAIHVALRKSGEAKARPGGAKDFTAVFVPGALPLAAALARVTSGDPANQFLAALFFLAALAAALGDWTSTDLGKTYGKRTYQIITFERVRGGTRGAVSVAGSAYGGIAVLAFAVLAALLFHVSGLGRHVPDIGVKETIVIVLAAVLANHIESVIGGILAQFQRTPNKQALNFAGSLIAAGLAVFFTNLPEG